MPKKAQDRELIDTGTDKRYGSQSEEPGTVQRE